MIFKFSFFSPKGTVPACGMFTTDHLIGLAICLFCVTTLALFLKADKKRLSRITRILPFIVSFCELIKIVYSFLNGYTWIDSWLPLSFCSIFIYAVWLSSYGKKELKKAGDAYITIGCPLAGLCFLVFPTTSLMDYPIWHFLSLYSMMYHSCMLLLGILYIKAGIVRINKQSYLTYIKFFTLFVSISTILNTLTGSNLMLLSEPYNLPITFFRELGEKYPFIYTLVALGLYISAPCAVSILIQFAYGKKREVNNCDKSLYASLKTMD